LFTRHGEALGIQMGALGPTDPAVTESLVALGAGLEAQGSLGKALSLYREDAAAKRAALGPSALHPDLADALSRVGVTLWRQGEFAEALATCREVRWG
jgi:tetratricopeptide (TPR) repeat protein